ncbi:MAG: 23S ribosomal RNA methyltransferase Erm [Thermomicrobiales bacterium]
MSSSSIRRRIALSQNFLHSRKLVDRLLAQSSISGEDLVVEIGPGTGIITERLAQRCHEVLAVEADPELARRLRRRFAGVPNVAVFATDFLAFPLPATAYKVFASIPFNITAAIMTKLTGGAWTPDDAYLVVQCEAAAKILGGPGESMVGSLLKPWFEPALIHRFRPTDFIPPPGVDVVMLRLRKRGPPLVTREDARCYRDFVVAVFTAWQPTVRQALSHLVGKQFELEVKRQSGFDLDQPPTALSFDEWLALFASIRDANGNGTWRKIDGAEERLRQQQAGLQKVHRTRAGAQAKR